MLKFLAWLSVLISWLYDAVSYWYCRLCAVDAMYTMAALLRMDHWGKWSNHTAVSNKSPKGTVAVLVVVAVPSVCTMDTVKVPGLLLP